MDIRDVRLAESVGDHRGARGIGAGRLGTVYKCLGGFSFCGGGLQNRIRIHAFCGPAPEGRDIQNRKCKEDTGMKKLSLEQELKGNAYPGRGIAIGKTPKAPRR